MSNGAMNGPMEPRRRAEYTGGSSENAPKERSPQMRRSLSLPHTTMSAPAFDAHVALACQNTLGEGEWLCAAVAAGLALERCGGRFSLAR